jgi:hypothetical protein
VESQYPPYPLIETNQLLYVFQSLNICFFGYVSTLSSSSSILSYDQTTLSGWLPVLRKAVRINRPSELFHLQLMTYDSARNVLTPPKIANTHTPRPHTMPPLSVPLLLLLLQIFTLFNSSLSPSITIRVGKGGKEQGKGTLLKIYVAKH